MGTALYVRLMVYTGLSLLTIRRANVYLVVCVLTHITLHQLVGSSQFSSSVDFFLDVFTEFSDKIFVIAVKGLQPSTSCVRNHDATTAPARHM